MNPNSCARERSLLLKSIPEFHVAFRMTAQNPAIMKFLYNCIKTRNNLARIKGSVRQLRIISKEVAPFAKNILLNDLEFMNAEWKLFCRPIASWFQSRGIYHVDIQLSAVNLLDTLSEEALVHALNTGEYGFFFIGPNRTIEEKLEEIPDWVDDLPVAFKTLQEQELDF